MEIILIIAAIFIYGIFLVYGEEIKERFKVTKNNSSEVTKNNSSEVTKNNSSEVTKNNSSETGNTSQVEIIDINLPFLSMVIFMVKWVLASIPAMMILGLLFGILMALVRGEI
jgi:ABC-type sugar transport system permease subunit